MNPPFLKEITVKLLDTKRDVITADCIYWVDDGCLFPFDASLVNFTQKDHDEAAKIEQALSMAYLSDSDRVRLLAKLLRSALQRELDNAEADHFASVEDQS